eukprot:CAMPEP_0174839136 /NCGR_PEP_ID=MMETSP1114-20130205/7855_1 /TAXON_ID=312471 /ORGANISM="Neobodo designis, Strain CCAP 1951/1" /LENGTH=293 /DNA_ID=CAMNT_0016073257 /DNA_START=41 /DNA_END=918 /DNA_ORIENTATION=+
MSPSQQLTTAVNFAAEYYSQLITNPAALAASYHASCDIVRGEKTHADAAAYFKALPVGKHRVVITDVSVSDAAPANKNGLGFTVSASNVFANGNPSAQFTQTFEIVKHNQGYYIAIDKLFAVTCSPVASAFAAFSSANTKKAPAKQPPQPATGARLGSPTPKASADKAKPAPVAEQPVKPVAPMNWSEDTPPAFAAKPEVMPPPMPMEDASPPKSAPETAAPSPAAPAQAKSKKAPATPKKAEPATTTAPAQAEEKPAAAAPKAKPEPKAAAKPAPEPAAKPAPAEAPKPEAA